MLTDLLAKSFDETSERVRGTCGMCEDRERWYEYGIGYLSAITLLPGEDHSVVFTFGRSDITKGFLEAAREEIAELKKRHVLIRGVERGVHVRSLSNDRVTAASTKFNCEPTTASNCSVRSH